MQARAIKITTLQPTPAVVLFMWTIGSLGLQQFHHIDITSKSVNACGAADGRWVYYDFHTRTKISRNVCSKRQREKRRSGAALTCFSAASGFVMLELKMHSVRGREGWGRAVGCDNGVVATAARADQSGALWLTCHRLSHSQQKKKKKKPSRAVWAHLCRDMTEVAGGGPGGRGLQRHTLKQNKAQTRFGFGSVWHSAAQLGCIFIDCFCFVFRRF